MKNVAAARRLRKSMLEKNKVDSIGLINSIVDKRVNTKLNKKDEFSFLDDDENDNENIGLKLKTKLVVKLLLSIFIVFVSLLLKLIYPAIVRENIYIGKIANEYKKDYSKDYILDKVEQISYNLYDSARFFVPKKLIDKIQYNYINNIKPSIIEFTISNSISKIIGNTTKKDEVVETMNTQEVNIYSDSSNTIMENEQKTVDEETIQTSSVKDVPDITDENAAMILSKKISIIAPVSGVITSRYGEREKIFEDLSPYHTGIDIANSLNTEIKSATSGIVKKTEYNNKYYGHNY